MRFGSYSPNYERQHIMSNPRFSPWPACGYDQLFAVLTLKMAGIAALVFALASDVRLQLATARRGTRAEYGVPGYHGTTVHAEQSAIAAAALRGEGVSPSSLPMSPAERSWNSGLDLRELSAGAARYAIICLTFRAKDLEIADGRAGIIFCSTGDTLTQR